MNADYDGYHDTRFSYDENRSLLWKTLCDAYFNKIVPNNAAVLELGAGYCDFINNIQAKKKYAIDIWDGVKEFAEQNVHAVTGDLTNLDFIDDESIDFVFASNVFEHISQEHLSDCLEILFKKLKSDGTINILQPNYKYAYREYFDDYTHVSIYSDISLADFLKANDFHVIEVKPKFLPLSIKSRLPVSPTLIKLYLRFPFSPLGKQMLIRAQKRENGK